MFRLRKVILNNFMYYLIRRHNPPTYFFYQTYVASLRNRTYLTQSLPSWLLDHVLGVFTRHTGLATIPQIGEYVLDVTLFGSAMLTDQQTEVDFTAASPGDVSSLNVQGNCLLMVRLSKLTVLDDDLILITYLSTLRIWVSLLLDDQKASPYMSTVEVFLPAYT